MFSAIKYKKIVEVLRGELVSSTKIAKDYRDENGNQIIGTASENINVNIFFRGKGNKLIIGENVKLRDTYIRFDAHNAIIVIGSGVHYRGSIRAGIACEVNLGDGLTVTEKCYISCAERTQIIVGKDCMFASFNQLRTDDAHPIFDLYTKKRINVSKSIMIGNHVWLGYESVVLGGTEIGSGSVVGMRSLLKNTFPTHSLITGIPAKVVKDNIAWERTHVNLLPPFEFDSPVNEIINYKD